MSHLRSASGCGFDEMLTCKGEATEQCTLIVNRIGNLPPVGAERGRRIRKEASDYFLNCGSISTW